MSNHEYRTIHLLVGERLVIDTTRDLPVLLYGSMDATLPVAESSGFMILTGIGTRVDLPVGVDYLIETEGDDDQGCECEIDWKCGVCREAGRRHSLVDGPDFVVADQFDGEPF